MIKMIEGIIIRDRFNKIRKRLLKRYDKKPPIIRLFKTNKIRTNPAFAEK